MIIKTLKDIKIEGFNGRMRLKAEAIKWIDKPRTLRMNANDFILVFFDITEEDLKLKETSKWL